MIIKILGSGCKKCVALANNAATALDALNIDADIQKVTDIVSMAQYGIMSTPGLVIDEQLVASGRVLSAVEIETIISDHAKKE